VEGKQDEHEARVSDKVGDIEEDLPARGHGAVAVGRWEVVSTACLPFSFPFSLRVSGKTRVLRGSSG
jgi:hypothetical protein